MGFLILTHLQTKVCHYRKPYRPDSTAQEVTEKREKIIILRDLIKDLPDQNKKILMLYYFEELKLSEIAQIFSLTEGRISQILSHSILCLRSNFRTLESN